MHVPALDDERAEPLDHVADRVDRRDVAEPGHFDQVARQVHARDERREEEQRELRLDAFAGAGAQREPEAERAPAGRDQYGEQQDEERACNTRARCGRRTRGRQPGTRRLQRAEPDGAADLADEERRAADGRQREPVQEARVDVAREVDAGDAGREQRSLQERERQEEREERGRREPRQVRRRAEAVRVDGHQHERERERRDPRPGLPERAHDRSPRDQPDLLLRHSPPAPLERAPRLREEDVVERRLVQVDLRGAEVLRVERAHDLRQCAVAVELDGERAGTRRRLGAEAAEQPAQPLELVGRLGHDLDGRLADLRLQLRRRALGDDPAVVDDPDAVGEDIGLLEVLRREEDCDALLAREAPDLVPERGAALRVEARSSARRGRGSTGRG